MTAAGKERAQRLHAESMVVNLHDHMGRAQDFADMRKGGVGAKVYKPINDGKYYDAHNRRVYPGPGFDWPGKYRESVAAIEKLEETPDARVTIVRRFPDFEAARAAGKSAVVLGNEGSLPLGPDLAGFDPLYRQGLREIALFWPAGNETKHILGEDRRLTPHARHIIDRANELGVAIDTCHLNSAGPLLEAVQASAKPTIHSHGAAIYPRSTGFPEGDLTDEAIRAIANNGGVIGIHFCTYIKNINGYNWQATMDDLMANVRYLVKIGGIDCVGIGADYFPYNRKPFDKAFQQKGQVTIEDRDWSNTFVTGLENISGMPLFTTGLVEAGFDDASIEKILGGNALRVFRANWKD